ncbi:hypothetical protein BD413DRAFT_476805 [Trametes elegans]|nr:hypothetical protein BD413DRAFT_476805 [Trametes elegans]
MVNVFVLGGSKNIGYYAAIRLLEQGATVAFLLRKTSVFDKDEQIQSYIKQGKVSLIQGDALVLEDVRKGWEAALEAGNGTVDVLLFTIGGTPNFQITKGIQLDPPDICRRALLNTLRTLPEALRAPATQPRIVVVTSRGILHAGHASLPLALKGFYSYALAGPHADKLGAERVLAHVLGRPWAKEDAEPRPDLLQPDWRELPGLPKEGELKKVVIVRPALLTDGPCQADEKAKKGKPGYRAVAGEIDGGYTVSRRDTAHFIVNGALAEWDKWEGKGVVVVY